MHFKDYIFAEGIHVRTIFFIVVSMGFLNLGYCLHMV